MSLTNIACRNAKPRLKPYKLADERGLYLEIAPSGSKWWRFKFSFAQKENRISLGVYPDISLAEARERRDSARKLLANGINPSLHRKLEKARNITAAANTFEAVAREWFAKHSPRWAATHSDKVLSRLERDILPWIGARPIGEIEPPELLAVLRRIEGRGTTDTAHRAHQNCGQVFRYAVATGRAMRDPTADLRGALAPVVKNHYPSVKRPAEVGALMRAIEGYKGTTEVRAALLLAALTFVRPGELRHAEWSEFDLDAREWRIPAEKMKAGVPHVVPLSLQVLAVLRELHPLTGRGRYLFPSERTRERPMSENTVNAALRRMGYAKDQMTGHGFRSIASTLLNEQGWNRDAIERQLAHGERDDVRAAYNYAEYLPERRKMMQAWADFLEKLKEGRNVATSLFAQVRP